ncbi:MAG: NAD(P)-binding protein [Nitrospira sp. BO4]|jgi:phytoene dehydrogenase-like protein|nr:NAD(P)-binding protein [Nitrospira sp. BO4]
MQRDKKGIAIVGAGLAGLTAAYFIRKWRRTLPITLFEATEREGGRLYTARRPSGEHGARYVLGSELYINPGGDYGRDYSLPDGTTIGELLEDSRVPLSAWEKWPHCCILSTRIFRRVTPTGRELQKDFPGAAKVILQLQNSSQAATGTFPDWVKQNLSTGTNEREVRDSLKIIKMVLAGETCAPWTHLSAQYALECLASAVNAGEKWYIIRDGSERLITALSRPVAKSIQRKHDCLKIWKSPRKRVAVRYRTATGVHTSYFQGAIVASPNGDALVGRRSAKRHFHSYLNILIGFHTKPTLTDNPHVDLGDGLYTDDPLLNYLEVERKKHTWVLRILTPDAQRFAQWRDSQIIERCKKVLTNLGVANKWVGSPSIRRWEYGLPCGGISKKFDKVSDGMYLCGDRYGRWPSMAGAIVSGARAADALLNDLDL